MMPSVIPPSPSISDGPICKICGKAWSIHNDKQKNDCWKELHKNGWSNEDFR